MKAIIALSLFLSSAVFAAPKIIMKGGIKFEGAAATSLRKMGGMIEGGIEALKLTRNKKDPNRVHIFFSDGDSKVFATFNVKNGVRAGSFHVDQVSETE
jgi:hypothetical protein